MLASLLCANLTRDSFVTANEGMQNVRNYLLIQQYRFSGKFSRRILVEPECEAFLIPNFILQPLIENAIIHGLEPKETDGKLAISILREEDAIVFIVADDGVGMTAETLGWILADMENEDIKTFTACATFTAACCCIMERDPGCTSKAIRK